LTNTDESDIVNQIIFWRKKNILRDHNMNDDTGAFRKYQIPNPKFGTRGPNLGFGIWCLVHTPSENTKSQMARAIFGDGRKSRAILCYG